MVVTLPAGASADAMARFIAERPGRELGLGAFVEHKSVLGGVRGQVPYLGRGHRLRAEHRHRMVRFPLEGVPVEIDR